MKPSRNERLPVFGSGLLCLCLLAGLLIGVAVRGRFVHGFFPTAIRIVFDSPLTTLTGFTFSAFDGDMLEDRLKVSNAAPLVGIGKSKTIRIAVGKKP